MNNSVNVIQKLQSNKLAQQVSINYWKERPEEYFSSCLKIQHKQTIKTIPFKLNKHQRKIQDAIDELRRAGKPVRIQVLKPRQTGISTVSLANIFHTNRFNGGTAMVVSKDGDSAEHLHTINQRFYNYLPASEKKILKIVASNRKELKYEEPHGGRILVETAGKSSAGHSFTIHQLILSEGSRWPDGCEDTRVGLLSAVPNTPNTIVIKESVANGMSGQFYKDWIKKDSDYVKIFLGCFDHDEYSLPLPIESGLYRTTMTEEERKLESKFHLSLEQIEWRRWAIINLCDDDLDKFNEQYPYTATGAFISSGNTFFHMPTLENIETSDGMRCDLRVFEQDRTRRREIRPADNKRGFLWVYKRPLPGHSYVMAMDVAEGIEIDEAPAGDKRDYSPADVIDRNTGEQVAHLHAQITPDEFGKQCAILGEWYNWAFVAPEMNGGYGWHVVETMLREKYPEYLFYKTNNEYGWKTTRANKKSLMSNLDMAIRAGDILVKNEDTLNELKAFVTKADGKLEGGKGHKDDRVISLAIANHILRTAPPMDLFTSDSLPSFTPVRYKQMRSIYERRFNASR